MNGLYGYWDKIKKIVVYIGQSNDVEGRLKKHMEPTRYDAQQINKVIQNNPERYEPFIFVEGDFTRAELNELEYEAVEIFKTNRYKYPENEGFNFKDGGKVKEMEEETKQKISESLMGHGVSEETKKKMSEAQSGENHWNYNNTIPDETRKKISEAKKGKLTGDNSPHWKNYARIVKSGFERGKQNYCINFNGDKLKRSIYIDKLVKWFNETYPNEELVIDESIKPQ